VEGIALLGDARDAGPRARAALRARGRPDRARLVVTSPPYLRVVKYGYYNWLRTWFLGFDSRAIDAALDDAHHREPYLAFMRDVLAGIRSALTDDAVIVLVIGDVETDRGRKIRGGVGLAERVWELAAEPEGYRLAGVALDDVAAVRKMTKLWGDEAGRATKTDRILVLGSTETGRRRALAGASLDIDWSWPPRSLRPL
jgi:site-specific DNA-methyltransferase (adenine-specific)